MVADVARPALLGDRPGQLGVRVAGDLGKVPPDQALPGPGQAEVVAEPDQRPLNELVGRLAVVGGDVRPIAAAEEGADESRGCECVRCRVSTSSSNDLFAPVFGLVCSILGEVRWFFRCVPREGGLVCWMAAEARPSVAGAGIRHGRWSDRFRLGREEPQMSLVATVPPACPEWIHEHRGSHDKHRRGKNT